MNKELCPICGKREFAIKLKFRRYTKVADDSGKFIEFKKDQIIESCINCGHSILNAIGSDAIRFIAEKEFKVSENIVLRLEGGNTNIYVNDKPFMQCKYLLLNLRPADFDKFDQIESIDEAEQIYNKLEEERKEKEEEEKERNDSLVSVNEDGEYIDLDAESVNIDKELNNYDRANETDKSIIDPEMEFVGHCSNMQAWYEYDYDPAVLHSNLSVPLLKRLVQIGDKKALIVLKETMLERLTKDIDPLRYALIKDEYLYLLNVDEIKTILDILYDRVKDENEQKDIIKNIYELIDILEKTKAQKELIEDLL